MNKIIQLIVAFLVLVSVSACSFVTVPPAHKGKVLSPAGYAPEVLEAGKETLWWRQSLVLLDVSTDTYTEVVKVILADRQEIHVEVNFRGRIRDNDRIINTMFNDIALDTSKRQSTVSFNDVYRIYGQRVVRTKTREILNELDVDEVHRNYSSLSESIGAVIVSALEDSPIEVGNVTIGDIDYPEIVTAAIQAAEERRLAIQQEEAQQAIEMLKRQNARLLAQEEYETRMIQARTIRDENRVIGEGVTPELLELKRLEYMTLLADKAGEGTVYVPTEFAGSVGVSNRVFSRE